MADTLASKLKLRLEATRTVGLDQGTQRATHAVDVDTTLPDGTSASQADEVWSDSRTVNAGAHDNHDLTDLDQLDDDGDTVRSGITFAGGVVALAIENKSSSDYLEVGGGTDGAGAADAWAGAGLLFKDDSDIISIPAGGCLFWFAPAGAAVTNSSADILHIGGITSNQDYEIAIIGHSS